MLCTVHRQSVGWYRVWLHCDEVEEKYEMVHSSASVMSAGSYTAVEFVVTDESIVEQRVIRRDEQQVCTTDDRHQQSDGPSHTVI